jgi:transposase InsO family protein
VRFAFIREMEKDNAGMPRDERFPVELMCEALEVSRAGYYAWKNRGVSTRASQDEDLTERIVAIHQGNEGRYGIDRIHAELARQGHRHSPKRVRRLARAAGLECVHPRPYKRTTIQDPGRAPRGLVDLVERDVVPEGPDQLWYGDITYIHTLAGWSSLATVIDGYSRKVVGWAVNTHMREELVLDAMRMAIWHRRPATGQLIMHTDRGAQYTGHAFRDLCLTNGILPSVGHTGICFDNAAAESFNATLKKELINLHVWSGSRAVKQQTFSPDDQRMTLLPVGWWASGVWWWSVGSLLGGCG